MGRIVKRRKGAGYEREITVLTRLRTALVLDEKLSAGEKREEIVGQVDKLITSLSQLIREGLNI